MSSVENTLLSGYPFKREREGALDENKCSCLWFRKVLGSLERAPLKGT